jgi:hypothetical protein
LLLHLTGIEACELRMELMEAQLGIPQCRAHL